MLYTMRKKYLVRVTLGLFLSLFIWGCTQILVVSSIKSVEEEGRLIVLTRQSSTTYMLGEEGEGQGFEYDLVKAFAEAQGWKVEIETFETTQQVLRAMERGLGHIAAAGLTKTQERQALHQFGPTYKKVQQQVVCGPEVRGIRKVEDLAGLDIKVSQGTSQEERLRALQVDHPEITHESVRLGSEEILDQLWQNQSLCTIVDSNILKVHRSYFPELKVVYTFKEEDELAWIVNKVDPKLEGQLTQWFRRSGSSTVESLNNRYYGHIPDFDYYDTKVFLDRIESRLPEYEADFKKAAELTGFDWKLLAALGYQESQWDPEAVSPTGVRGLMMLTQRTAKSMGVEDRLDPQQSIDGGARYLKKLHGMVPDYVRNGDRLWFALAAYNVGFYHLRDAMALTILQNKDPSQWAEVRTVLPLLSQERYFKNLRFGYAREIGRAHV